MADVSIKYKGSTIAEMSGTGTKTLKTAGTYCEGDISVDYAPRCKIYDLTLSGGSGWVLLTKLDDIVLQHINDRSLVVSFVCTDEYVYSFYSARFCIAANNILGRHNSRDVYALTSRQPSEASINVQASPYPANYTGSTDNLGSYSTFRFANNSYYLKPADGYVAAGHYRLTFVW